MAWPLIPSQAVCEVCRGSAVVGGAAQLYVMAGSAGDSEVIEVGAIQAEGTLIRKTYFIVIHNQEKSAALFSEAKSNCY